MARMKQRRGRSNNEEAWGFSANAIVYSQTQQAPFNYKQTSESFVFSSFMKRVLVALEEAGVFTSGGLVKDRSSSVAQRMDSRHLSSS
ncbi:hypothetical protein QN277_012326 [Acacia crassicarpa]|uniref:Uncharacterized protein n=1 Tax=Acacia crassicarpa TaxID=499986 RepID=A0AAE1TEG7_9FABA|nr:hypothetical protein QN277_012326 [Acacia crassicarpa]